jgi:hypothetical protein
MLKKTFLCTSLVASVFAIPTASADDLLARFKGGFGVIPLSNITAPAVTDPLTPLTNDNVVRNVVRGVTPAGQIWVIDKLDAKVSMNGRISVEGKGLILGGGNNIGRASGQSVFATLICDGSNEQFSSTLTGVPLTVTGDFRINDRLTPVPPGNCANPVLLIRNAANGGWFAAGILRPKDDD